MRSISLSARIGLPSVTAALLRTCIKRVKLGKKSSRDDVGEISILVLRKIGFDEDIHAVFAEAGNVAIWGITHRAIKAVSKTFLPIDTTDNNYARDDESFEKAKRRCCAYWKKVWPRLVKKLPLHAVLTGNHAYWAEQELARAMEELGAPFVALHKESFKSQGFYDYTRKVTAMGRAPFSGRRILVYCREEMEAQIRAGVALREKFSVIGMPRMDPIHQRRMASISPAPHPPTVLFFSFTANAGLPDRLKMTPLLAERLNEDDRESLKLHWTRLAPLVHTQMVELARAHLEIQIVIKAKKSDRQFVDPFVDASGPRPPNLTVHYRGDLADLLEQADVVCGLASTSLVEAIAADKPIVVPRFEEAAESAYERFIPDYGGLAQRAETPEELVEMLARIAREQRRPLSALPERAIAYLDECIGNADGKSGKRAYEAIVEEIRDSGNKARTPLKFGASPVDLAS